MAAPRGESRWPVIGCIVVLAVLGLLAYGFTPPAPRGVLPVCGCGDVASQAWFVEWPAYALSHGLNPFYSQAVDLPRGVNLMSNTAAPLLGILFSPLTLLAGPVATLNLLFRLGFALSGISMFLVLRRFVTWWPAAFAGALLYAFSPYMVGQSQSHDFLTFNVLPPLMLALLEAIVIRRSHPLQNGALLGLTATAQLLISPEVLSICAVITVSALALVAVRHPVATKERLITVAQAGAAGVGSFAVTAAYPIWMYFRGPFHLVGPPHPLSELMEYHSAIRSLIYPTNLERFGFGSWVAKGSLLIQGNGVEHTTYLGVPMILLLAYLVIRNRRSGMIQLFTLVALVSWAVTLGPSVSGMSLKLLLPYNVVRRIPFVNGALDLRYSFGLYFGVAVVLAIGLEGVHSGGLWERRSEGAEDSDSDRSAAWTASPAVRIASPVVLAVIGLLPLLPALPYENTPVAAPGVLTHARSVIRTGDRVLLSPIPIDYGGSNDQALLWQAMSGMRFRMVGFRGAIPGPNGHPLRGAAILLPPPAAEEVLVWGVYGKPAPPPRDAATASAIRSFLRRYEIDDVAIVPSGPYTGGAVKYFEAALGRPPEIVGGVDVWPQIQSRLGG